MGQKADWAALYRAAIALLWLRSTYALMSKPACYKTITARSLLYCTFISVKPLLTAC